MNFSAYFLLLPLSDLGLEGKYNGMFCRRVHYDNDPAFRLGALLVSRRALAEAWLARALLMLALALTRCIAGDGTGSFPEARPLGRDLVAVPPTLQMPILSQSHSREALQQTNTLDLRQALALALRRNPGLASFSWEVRAAEARELQVGLWPNPEVSVDVENVSGNLRGFSGSETTIALAQRILFGGKRSRALQLAASERRLAGWAYESKRLDVFSEVVQSFVAVLGAQEKVKIAQEALQIAREVLAAVGKRVEAGDAPAVERIRAEVAHGVAATELQRALQELETARIRLASGWGSAEPHFSEVRGALEYNFTLPPLETLKQRLAQNPEIISAAIELTRRQAALAVERAKRIPDVSFMAGYRRLEGEGAHTVVLGLAAPLPLFDRNQGGILEAEANLSRAEWQKRDSELQVQAALAAAYAELAAADRERHIYTEQILPNAAEALRKTQEGYQQGSFDYLELLTAQETLAKTRASYIDALVRLNTAVAKVERLIGEPLVHQEMPVHEEKEQK